MIENLLMKIHKKKISQLHYDYNYSREQIPVARMKCILNAVCGDGLEPVYVFFERWKDVEYKQRDFEKLKLLYPKREHDILVNLEKEELQILLEELDIEEEEYINNALEEIERMVTIYGNKCGYALMTEEEKRERETHDIVLDGRKDTYGYSSFYAVMLIPFVLFILMVDVSSLKITEQLEELYYNILM